MTEAKMTTSVRIPAAAWEWAKKNKVNMSDALLQALRAIRKKKERKDEHSPDDSD